MFERWWRSSRVLGELPAAFGRRLILLLCSLGLRPGGYGCGRVSAYGLRRGRKNTAVYAGGNYWRVLFPC